MKANQARRYVQGFWPMARVRRLWIGTQFQGYVVKIKGEKDASGDNFALCAPQGNELAAWRSAAEGIEKAKRLADARVEEFHHQEYLP